MGEMEEIGGRERMEGTRAGGAREGGDLEI